MGTSYLAISREPLVQVFCGDQEPSSQLSSSFTPRIPSFTINAHCRNSSRLIKTVFLFSNLQYNIFGLATVSYYIYLANYVEYFYYVECFYYVEYFYIFGTSWGPPRRSWDTWEVSITNCPKSRKLLLFLAVEQAILQAVITCKYIRRRTLEVLTKIFDIFFNSSQTI